MLELNPAQIRGNRLHWRKVIAFRELETYEKTQRTRAVMRHRAPATP
jgi:hypothetical protein